MRPYPSVRHYAVIIDDKSSRKIIIYFQIPAGYILIITASCVSEKAGGRDLREKPKKKGKQNEATEGEGEAGADEAPLVEHESPREEGREGDDLDPPPRRGQGVGDLEADLP